MAKGYHSYVIMILLPVSIPAPSAYVFHSRIWEKEAHGNCLFVSRYSLFGIGYHFTEMSTVSAIILIRRHFTKQLVRILENGRGEGRDSPITPTVS